MAEKTIKQEKKQIKTEDKKPSSKGSQSQFTEYFAKKMPIGTRGRRFEGFVIKKFPKRAVIEFERTVYVQKYERFYKKKTKLHARLPENLVLEVGDYVELMECRPLSKIIHFIVTRVIRKGEHVNSKPKETKQ